MEEPVTSDETGRVLAVLVRGVVAACATPDALERGSAGGMAAARDVDGWMDGGEELGMLGIRDPD